MTTKPLIAEPFTTYDVRRWREQVVGPRHVDPELPWPDRDVMTLVARFLATLDAARHSTGSSATAEGLRAAAQRLVEVRSHQFDDYYSMSRSPDANGNRSRHSRWQHALYDALDELEASLQAASESSDTTGGSE